MILYMEYSVCREHANAMTLCIRNLNISEYLFSGPFSKQWPNITQKTVVFILLEYFYVSSVYMRLVCKVFQIKYKKIAINRLFHRDLSL